MVWIPGGRFLMGSDHHYPEEKPARRVRVDGFWMDRTPVTNRQFEAFVRATGHVTTAEIAPQAKDYPGADPRMLKAASLVFTPTRGPVPLGDVSQWWSWTFGASWRRPRGPGSTLAGLEDHPVVHVAWADVAAYAAWAGKSLPTEAEWEFAAWGGRPAETEFAWGTELVPGGVHMANTFQGAFPHANSCEDGFAFTSPVGSFPPNDLGLVDMIGNVWEWTADWFAANPGQVAEEPVLRDGKSARGPGDRQLRPRPPRHPDSTEGPERRLTHVCARLLSALQTRGPARSVHRHLNEPSGFPLRRTPEGMKLSGRLFLGLSRHRTA